MSLNDDNKFNYEGGREMIEKTLAIFSADEDGCCHVSIAKEILVRNGKIQPLISPHCNTENRLPLRLTLDFTNNYFLECQHCGQVLWREKDWRGLKAKFNSRGLSKWQEKRDNRKRV